VSHGTVLAVEPANPLPPVGKEDIVADVNIQQTPPPAGDGRGSSGAVWAIVALVLLLVVGWLVFGGGLNRTTDVDVDVNAPAGTGTVTP
jgi:hypothetical protein